MSEAVDEESVNNDSKKENEDILGESAAPISSMHANNRDFKILTTDYEHAQPLQNTMDD